jgi:ribosomal protein S12 methylthiotransferase accessory factor
MIPFERDVTVSDALARAHQTLQRRGLRATSTRFGGALCTVEVALRDVNGTVLATGHGKGDATSARVGGLFEAIEHYMSLHAPEAFQCISSPVEAVRKALGSPVDALLAAQPGRSLGCRPYCDMHDGTTQLLPTGLVQPRYITRPLPDDTFDYNALERYASNSGTAIGSTPTEAMLHGLNESIERDDVSRWLFAHFHAQTSESLQLIDRATCDTPLALAWRAAETALGDEVVLVDASTRDGTSTRMAFAMHWPHAVHLYGAGCSRCPAHAGERALAELVQQAVRSKGTELMDAFATQTLNRLAAWPALARACRANLPGLMGCKPLAWVRAGTRAPWSTPKDMLRSTVNELVGDGYRPLVYWLTAQEDVSLCSIVVPGFSRYFLVGNGIPVAPLWSRSNE